MPALVPIKLQGVVCHSATDDAPWVFEITKSFSGPCGTFVSVSTAWGLIEGYIVQKDHKLITVAPLSQYNKITDRPNPQRRKYYTGLECLPGYEEISEYYHLKDCLCCRTKKQQER